MHLHFLICKMVCVREPHDRAKNTYGIPTNEGEIKKKGNFPWNGLKKSQRILQCI